MPFWTKMRSRPSQKTQYLRSQIIKISNFKIGVLDSWTFFWTFVNWTLPTTEWSAPSPSPKKSCQETDSARVARVDDECTLLLELKLCLFQTTKLCSQSKHQKPQLLSVWFALPHWIKYHTKKLSQRKTQRYALSIWKHCLDFLLAPKPTRFSNTWKLRWKKIVVYNMLLKSEVVYVKYYPGLHA